jgi:hypothetical protein
VTALFPVWSESIVLGDGAVATPRAALGITARHEMRRLMTSHFDGVTETQFDRDLASKDWVLRFSRDGVLVGFSTLQVFSTVHDGRAVNVIYSGDTVMAPEAWGSPVLARAWIALVRRIQESHP